MGDNSNWFADSLAATLEGNDSAGLAIGLSEAAAARSIERNYFGSLLSVDGLTRTDSTDADGNGTADTITTDAITYANGARAETTTTHNADGSLRSSISEIIAGDWKRVRDTSQAASTFRPVAANDNLVLWEPANMGEKLNALLR